MRKKSGTAMAHMDGRLLAVKDEHQLAEDLGRFANKRDMALYIADVTLQMRNMARAAEMHFLAYLLEMSFQEAFDIGNGGEGGAESM